MTSDEKTINFYRKDARRGGIRVKRRRQPVSQPIKHTHARKSVQIVKSERRTVLDGDDDDGDDGWKGPRGDAAICHR